MGRIGVRVEKANSERFYSLLHQIGDAGAKRCLLRHRLNRAVKLHALHHLTAQMARHERFRKGKSEIEQIVTRLARHIEHVAEAFGN